MTCEDGGEDDDTDKDWFPTTFICPVCEFEALYHMKGTCYCGQCQTERGVEVEMVIKEDYKHGWDLSSDKGGVRGREEIEGIVSDLDVLIEEAEGDAHPLLVERLAGISEDLKGVLGEDGDL